MTKESNLRRSPERLKAHYEVEKELAARLRHSTWKERKKLYGHVYRELIHRVTDHPMLTQTRSAEAARGMVLGQLKLLRRYLLPHVTFLEIGPGDCSLSFEVANHVRKVLALEVSPQLMGAKPPPENLCFALYDGVNLPIRDGSIDVVYSNSVIEHLHPDDTLAQIQEIHRVLKPEGAFLCVTPNKLSGPHDISFLFDAEAKGFHLKEYTNGELEFLLKKIGFRVVKLYVGVKGHYALASTTWARLCESTLGSLPQRIRRPLAGGFPLRALLGVRIVATK